MALGSTQPLTEILGYLLGGRGGWCVWLTSLPPLCADSLEIMAASTSWRIRSPPRPAQVCLPFTTFVSGMYFNIILSYHAAEERRWAFGISFGFERQNYDQVLVALEGLRIDKNNLKLIVNGLHMKQARQSLLWIITQHLLYNRGKRRKIFVDLAYRRTF